MTNTITLENGNEVETGCWLDGAAGWTNSYRVVDIATHHGMTLDADDQAVVDWYREGGESEGASDAELDKLEGMTGQGGITDRAIEYLEERLPEGWTLCVDMGEYIVTRVELACAAEGNGCEVLGFGDDGSETVKLCRDHNPCEGHGGEDAQLTSGVGIGETVYCDGSCVKH